MSDLKNHKGLAIAHLNIRSIWHRIDVLKINLQNNIDIDIFGISETWLTKGLSDNLVNIPNYDILRCDRGWSEDNNNIDDNINIKKGGGVCMYIKNELNYSTHAMNVYDVSCKNVECHWARIIQEKQRNVIIGNLYRPPQGKVKNFIDYLEGVFEHLDLAREDLILMGDFNIDFLDKNSQDFKLLYNLIKQTGLDILINKPTHFSSQKNSCIDQIISIISKLQ